ncbi:MAG: hypothetical protein IH804_06780 [Planctomycetes bacterium]|nr:hypothetical protein [Planctomycetota bacterium]
MQVQHHPVPRALLPVPARAELDQGAQRAKLVRVEFGSDAFFITIPTPGVLALFGLAAVSSRRRRRTA